MTSAELLFTQVVSLAILIALITIAGSPNLTPFVRELLSKQGMDRTELHIVPPLLIRLVVVDLLTWASWSLLGTINWMPWLPALMLACAVTDLALTTLAAKRAYNRWVFVAAATIGFGGFATMVISACMKALHLQVGGT